MPSNTYRGIKPIKSMHILYINLRSYFIQLLLRGHSKHGNRYHRTYQPFVNKRLSVHLSNNDYFSKWAEAIPLIEVKTSNVVNFIKHDVIQRFGVPRRIIHDNGPQFASQVFYQFCNKYRIQNITLTLIILLLMVQQKHSTRQLSSYSRNLFHQANEIGIRSSVNVFGPTELRSELQQAIRLFLWYTGAK